MFIICCSSVTFASGNRHNPRNGNEEVLRARINKSLRIIKILAVVGSGTCFLLSAFAESEQRKFTTELDNIQPFIMPCNDNNWKFTNIWITRVWYFKS